MSRREEGVAVVLAIGLTALLLLVAVVGGGVVAIMATHRQAQAAADLAALAGATAGQSGEPVCEAVERVAGRNGGNVRTCEVEGSTVRVIVECQLPAMFAGRTVRAQARAGPVDEPGSRLS
jgi:secretion/DNA translocation related TadE-like protein